MDDTIVTKKLESLARCIGRLQQKKPESLEILRNDLDAQDIIVVNLERAVQLCVDTALVILAERNDAVPSTMAESFELLTKPPGLSAQTAQRMRNAVGFRNIAVHAYRQIDWAVVWSILNEHLDDFRSFAKEILEIAAKL